MQVYLLVAVPLSYVYVVILRDLAGSASSLITRPLLTGALSTVVIALVLSFVVRFAVEPFSGPGLFFYTAVTNYLLPVYLGFGLYLLFIPSPGSLSPDEAFLSFLSFLAGHFAVQGVIDLFDPAFVGVYELFVAPTMRVALMIIAAVAYFHYREETFWTRYLYMMLLAVAPFAVAVPHLLFSMNLVGAAIPVTATLFVGSFGMVLFWTGGRSTIQFR